LLVATHLPQLLLRRMLNLLTEIVRKILYIKPYDFILNLSKQGIYIKTKEDEYFIGCK
jgi:hypothetical protein